MEIPAEFFFRFWGFIGLMFLKLGLNAIHKTELSNSVPPTVMFLFQVFSIVSLGFSYIYGATLYLHEKISVNEYAMVLIAIYPVFFNDFVSFAYLNHLLFAIHGFAALFFILFEFRLTRVLISIKFTMLSLIFMNYFFPDKLMFTASLALTALSLLSPYWRGRLIRDAWSFDTPPSTDPTHVNFVIDNRSRVKRWAEFAVGMVGSILFQKFFRLTSFDEVAAFFYFAVAWLANIVLVSASHDLGVFNFLLGNVIVGCSVNEYGLRGPTWIAYGAAILLYGLRVKLESVVLVNRGGKGTQVVIW